MNMDICGKPTYNKKRLGKKMRSMALCKIILMISPWMTLPESWPKGSSKMTEEIREATQGKKKSLGKSARKIDDMTGVFHPKEHRKRFATIHSSSFSLFNYNTLTTVIYIYMYIQDHIRYVQVEYTQVDPS